MDAAQYGSGTVRPSVFAAALSCVMARMPARFLLVALLHSIFDGHLTRHYITVIRRLKR